MWYHRHIGTLRGGTQKSLSRAAPRAVAHGHVHPAEPFLLRTIDVGGQRIARLPRSIDPRLIEWIFHRAVAGIERAIAAARGVAPFLPSLEIARVAPHIDKAVDR